MVELEVSIKWITTHPHYRQRLQCYTVSTNFSFHFSLHRLGFCFPSHLLLPNKGSILVLTGVTFIQSIKQAHRSLLTGTHLHLILDTKPGGPISLRVRICIRDYHKEEQDWTDCYVVWKCVIHQNYFEMEMDAGNGILWANTKHTHTAIYNAVEILGTGKEML